jgi:hypothetical protein
MLGNHFLMWPGNSSSGLPCHFQTRVFCMCGRTSIYLKPTLDKSCTTCWAFKFEMFVDDLGKRTHTLVPCWMIVALPPRNECTGCFAPTMVDNVGSFASYSIINRLYLATITFAVAASQIRDETSAKTTFETNFPLFRYGFGWSARVCWFLNIKI